MVLHLLFDLGGVILQIDPGAFTRHLSIDPASTHSVRQRAAFQQVLLDYERGYFTENEFIDRISKLLPYAIQEGEIKKAWNSILQIPFPDSKEFLGRLGQTYTLALLSNTNETHRRKFDEIFDNQWGSQRFYDLFQQVFYSYELRMAKPQEEIFQSVLSALKWSPENTLFIDDNQENVEAAAHMGMSTWEFAGPKDWPAIMQMLGL
ncbi:MAG: HAD family phosphatase [Bacteroidetes bacterium]|jgi:putative hydrolase of the HAD superfamily|nr:HAD family phosphatase [Bacteroidota bacterium]